MRVMVTGHAGFIGSHVAEALLDLGIGVIGVDNLNDYYDPRLKVLNVDRLVSRGLESHVLDLASDPLSHLVHDVDAIIHLAAQPGISASSSLGDYVSNNIVATQAILAAAGTAPALQLFVYASTSSVYGRDATGNEEVLPRPISYYGVTKLCGEHLVNAAASQDDLPACSLRLYSVYGPRERPDKAFPRMIRACILGQEFPLYEGSEHHTRSFTYVADIVQGIVEAIRRPRAVRGRVINLGSAVEVRMASIISEIERITGRKLRVRQAPPRSGDQLNTRADIELARQLLDYTPSTSIQEGLAHEVEWIESRLSS